MATSLTAAGSAVQVCNQGGQAYQQILFVASNNFTGVTVVFEGTYDAGAATNWFPIPALNLATNAWMTGTITLTNATVAGFLLYAMGCTQVRMRVTAISTNTITIQSLGGDLMRGAIQVPIGLSGVTSIGYATGAGGAVTQITSRTTGVTINTLCGQITTDVSSLAAGAEAEFTVTNSQVAAGDCVVVALKVESTTGTSLAYVSSVANGSFKITLTNLHAATADTSASVITFAIIKAVAS